MARHAIRGNIDINMKGAGGKAAVVRAMTKRAILSGRQMIPILANTDPSVVAECAVVRIDARVSKNYPSKGICHVTGRAILTGRYVNNRLTGSDHIIVAGHAIRIDKHTRYHMIKDARRKGTRSVATNTIFCGWHMIGVHTNDGITIVTRCTSDACNCGRSMVDESRLEGGCIMATTTIGICTNMILYFDSCYCVGAIMTGFTY